MSAVVRISESAKRGWSNVLVDSVYAEDLRRRLRSFMIETTPIQDSSFSALEIVSAADGRKQVRMESFDKTFDVQATLRGLDPVVRQWAATLD